MADETRSPREPTMVERETREHLGRIRRLSAAGGEIGARFVDISTRYHRQLIIEQRAAGPDPTPRDAELLDYVTTAADEYYRDLVREMAQELDRG